MANLVKKFFDSTGDISSHHYILLVSLFVMIFLLSLLPALLQLAIIIMAAFAK